MDELTERVITFQETGKGLEDLLARTAQTVFDYPRLRLRWDDEQCSRFYNDFYPKLLRMFHHYKEMGVSFKGYLAKNLRWFSLNYIRWNRENGWKSAVLAREAILTYEKMEDPHPLPGESLVCSQPPVYGKVPCRPGHIYLALLQHDRWDQPELEDFSRWAGLPAERCHRIVENLKDRMETRRLRFDTLIARRNSLYCQLLHLQYRSRESMEPAERDCLLEREAEIRNRLARIRSRIARSSCKPTHRELSEVLEIPRSTVSSAIHKLRKKR
jgi:hypothetical protein